MTAECYVNAYTDVKSVRQYKEKDLKPLSYLIERSWIGSLAHIFLIAECDEDAKELWCMF